MFTGISAVIPYYNDVETVPKCLGALRTAWKQLSLTQQEAFEVILVDDNSSFPFQGAPAEFPLHIFRTQTNQGVGNARNTGAQHAKFSHVLFIDSDVVLSPPYLCRLFGRLEADPQIKVLQGPFGKTPANENPGMFEKYLALSWSYINSLRIADENAGSLLSSGCVVFQNLFFRQIGGFVSTYKGSGGEEYEIVSRIAVGTILHDNHLLSYHHYDDLTERIRKLFKRGMNFFGTVVKNRNIPLSFKIGSGIKTLGALAMTGCYLIAFYDTAWAIFSYLVLGILYGLVNGRLILYVFKNGSLPLAVASIVFIQLEYTTIGIAIFLDRVGWNVNIQRT